MKTAAPDFRIIWDNAYAVHHLYPDPEPLANIVEECNAAGHPDRPFLVHLDLEDHLRRRRHVGDRGQRRQHELVPRFAHEAHDRLGQGGAAPSRPLPARPRRARRAHGEARGHPAAEVRGGARDPRARAGRLPASRPGPGRAAATSSVSTCPTAAPRAWSGAPRKPGVKLTGAGATFPRGQRSARPQHPHRAELPAARRAEAGDRDPGALRPAGRRRERARLAHGDRAAWRRASVRRDRACRAAAARRGRAQRLPARPRPWSGCTGSAPTATTSSRSSPYLGVPWVRFVFPHAPARPVTINQGYVMPAWYDITEPRARRRQPRSTSR